MVQRCTNPKSTGYKRYGARGVRVCERWLSFESFYADMGDPPTALHQLDRFPNQNGNYEPGNVRWATPTRNQRNRTNNRLLTHDGRTLCIAEWAEITGLREGTIRTRLSKGWSIDRTLSERGDARKRS